MVPPSKRQIHAFIGVCLGAADREQQSGMSLLYGKSLFKNFTNSIFLHQQWRKHNKVLPRGATWAGTWD